MGNAATKMSQGRGPRKAEPILVTGSERKYFLMTYVLLTTLRRFAPDLPLHVLDFGLEEAQRKFLRAYCTVLERPRDLGPGLHPMIYKAHMAGFLHRVKWRAMVWIDSDMIAVAPLGERLSALLAEMAALKREVAICREEGLATLGTIAASGAAFDHFARVVAREGIDLATPYYNTGIFACRSPDFLSEWSARARLELPQTVFDQNIFNLVLHRRGAPIDLDPKAWNVHGSLLAAARVVAAQPLSKVSVDGTETLIVHATSSRRDDIINAQSLEVAGVRLTGLIYLCRNPQLQALQQTLMTDAFAGVADKLRRLGIAEPLGPAP